jgi:hypothetical protein
MLRLKFHQIPLVHFSEEVAALHFHRRHNPMNSQTYFQERTTPHSRPFDELRRTSVWNGLVNWEMAELLSLQK